jgi:hypothetical protein
VQASALIAPLLAIAAAGFGRPRRRVDLFVDAGRTTWDTRMVLDTLWPVTAVAAALAIWVGVTLLRRPTTDRGLAATLVVVALGVCVACALARCLGIGETVGSGAD